MSTLDTLHAARAPGPETAPGSGVVLGRYRLGRRLGSGGFGVVWLARDERLERDVAVKAIPRAAQAGPRVEREALAAARLGHPAIVTLYEAGEDEGSCYLVSELVQGRPLAELMAEGALSDRDVLRIGATLADALAHAHARGVIHRDVKPANVIVPGRPGKGGAVAKLADFGVAHVVGDDLLTRTGDVVGTLAYMAPEQAEGRRVTGAADLYALALVVYEALAGVNPIRGAGPAATARRVGSRLPSLARVRRDLPAGLCAAVDRALLPRPEERGTLGELQEALTEAQPLVEDEHGVVGGGALEALATRALPSARAPWGRALPALAAAALVAAAAVGLGGEPPAAPAALAAGTALAVALLPRGAWLVAAAAVVAWLAVPETGLAGTALVLAVALAAPPLLLRDRGAAWSLPALAPLLGLVGLAAAFPALAGQMRSVWHRAALGAAGFWWLLLAEPLLGRTLLFGAGAGTRPRAAWETSASAAAEHALAPAVASGALAAGVLWALAAAVLPVVVRGRSAAADIVAATAWAAGLAAATGTIGGLLAGVVVAPEPRGATAGALAAGAFAVAARAFRGEAAAQRVA